MQSLTFATTTDAQKNEQLNVGLIHRVDSPFDLFLNFEQLIDYSKRYVYFFVQSTGKRKVIMWGVFDKNENEFIVESGCRFKPVQLHKIVRKWRENGYKHAAAIVTDRFTDKILEYLDIKTWSYEDYGVYKRVLAFLNDKIDYDVMEKEYGPTFLYDLLPVDIDPTDEEDIEYYKEKLERQIKEYERTINFKDIDLNLKQLIGRSVSGLLEKITQEFDRQIQEKSYSEESYESILGFCPDIEKCNAGQDELCSVYSYGQESDLYGDDPDLYL